MSKTQVVETFRHAFGYGIKKEGVRQESLQKNAQDIEVQCSTMSQKTEDNAQIIWRTDTIALCPDRREIQKADPLRGLL